VTGVSVVGLIVGHRAAVALVFPVLPFPSFFFRPSKYLEPCPSPRERTQYRPVHPNSRVVGKSQMSTESDLEP
jgi:hypothetical protein